MTAADLLERGVEALARGDADALAQLTEAAAKVERPASEEQWQAAREKHRALGQLLILTRRNLRLLGRGEPKSCGWGPGAI